MFLSKAASGKPAYWASCLLPLYLWCENRLDGIKLLEQLDQLDYVYVINKHTGL